MQNRYKKIEKKDMEKQLPDVFKELQEIRKKQANSYNKMHSKIQNINTNNNLTNQNKSIKINADTKIDLNNDSNIKREFTKKARYKTKKISKYICRVAYEIKQRNIKLHQISIVLTIAILTFTLIGINTNNILAKEDKTEEMQKNENIQSIEFEENENAIDLLEVLSDNISVTTRKDIIAEEADIIFSTIYNENDKLPKGEEHIIEQGINGRKETTYLRTYENDEMISEEIVGLLVLEDPKKQIVEVGTSEFLAKHNVHIGERMFLKQDADLKEKNSNSSNTIAESIWIYMDVILLDFDENWCKVQYNDKIGYIQNDMLVTETTMPGVTELSRKQRIISKLDFNMKVNEPSNMSKEDFKKILTDTKDKNKIFENSSEIFYNMEKKYNINGVFLASVGIHESAWGTSKIAKDKNNLFGYMAYDRNPYAFSAKFDTYEDGIETLAKAFCKYYMYPSGTPIYDGEVAKGSYFNEPTVSGINVRYASDKQWCEKVYKTMTYLYSKLP